MRLDHGDGLPLVRGTSVRLPDKTRKDLSALFQKFGLDTTAGVSHPIVNLHDVTYNLPDEKYLPDEKPDSDLL